ncbi:MAG TPA: DUF4258 domain-containing protein [Longimicrobium sp.]|jgi:hypothetical protein|uniref:DUF4258 domain-containing protein n=1 Tax=Longimicrobium sp. TaxID=2029185 RepID=UPI002EDA30CB
MSLIEEIRAKAARWGFDTSGHAAHRALLRHVSISDIHEAIASGEIIEDYPDDKYGPSCLISGTIEAGRRLHVVCTHPSRAVLKIITVYEPDPEEWINARYRRG